MTLYTTFIEKYNRMEQAIRQYYKLHPSESIIESFRKLELRKYYNHYNIVREIRNLYSHKQPQMVNQYMQITQSTLDMIDTIYYAITNPERVIDNCVKLTEIVYASFNEPMLLYLKIMEERKYNTIPIIEDGLVKGVFTESSLLEWFSKDEIIMIDKDTSFNDIRDTLDLDNRIESFYFIKPTLTLTKLYKRYIEEFKQGKRIGIYFITENGKSDGKVMGMVTPYRIATYQYTEDI